MTRSSSHAAPRSSRPGPPDATGQHARLPNVPSRNFQRAGLASGLRCTEPGGPMSYLRHISTRRLLVLVAACLLAAGTGAAAIALAAGGAGPTPPPKALAQAIHDALAAPPPAGITARISFTNHLVDSASLQGTDPILTGATGRLWASGDRLRLELQASDPGGGGGDVQVLLDNDRLTVIDTGSNTVYRLAPPHDSKSSAPPGKQAAPPPPPIHQAPAPPPPGAHGSGAPPGAVARRPAD